MPGLILILKPRAPQERFEWPPWQAQSVLLLFRSDPKASLPLLLVMACQEGLQLKLEASASISQCWRMWLLQDTPSRASPKLPLVPFIVTINFSFYSLVCLWNDVIWGRRSLPEVSTIHSQKRAKCWESGAVQVLWTQTRVPGHPSVKGAQSTQQACQQGT